MRFSHRCRWRFKSCEILCLSLGVYFQTFRKLIVPSCSSSPRRISGTTSLFKARTTHQATKCHVLKNKNQMGMVCLCSAVFCLTSVPRTRTQACQRISLIFRHWTYCDIRRRRFHILSIFRCLCLQRICPAPGFKITYRNAHLVLTTSRFFSSPSPKF